MSKAQTDWIGNMFWSKQQKKSELDLKKEAIKSLFKTNGYSLEINHFSRCNFCCANVYKLNKIYTVVSPAGEVFHKETPVGSLCWRCAFVDNTPPTNYLDAGTKIIIPALEFIEANKTKPILREQYIAELSRLLGQIDNINKALLGLPGTDTPYRD
jgi:hypothetical protein